MSVSVSLLQLLSWGLPVLPRAGIRVQAALPRAGLRVQAALPRAGLRVQAAVPRV